MPKFAYAAIDAQGAPVEGVTKANTIGAARSLLVDQNLFPTKIEERRGMLDFELTAEKVKKKELMHFTRQLAVFVKAGIPLTDALVTIGDETEDVALRRALGGMIDDLRNGGLLSVTAANHPEAFPEYYVGILQAAELTGRLDESLESLAGYLEREIDTRSKVVSALSYPMIVMVMAFGTVLLLAGYVLPQFKPLFEELGAELPAPTRFMLFISRFFTDLWYITAACMMMFVGVILFLTKTEKGKDIKDRLVLKVPIISGIVDYATARTVLPHPRCHGQGRRPAARRPEDHDRVDEQPGVQGAARSRPRRDARRQGILHNRSSTPSSSRALPSRCSRSARRPVRWTSSSKSPVSTSTVSSKLASRSSRRCSSRS